MRAHVFNAALAVVLLSACASGGGGGGGSRPDRISREQIEAQGTPQEDAYTLVQRLHPNWLRARSSAGFSGDRQLPVVFLNGSRYGELDALRSFQINEIESMQFIGGTDATTRFGTGYGGGVIMVQTSGTGGQPTRRGP